MLSYRAYGLHIRSEISLPELVVDPRAPSDADVTISFNEVPADGLTDGAQIGPFLWASARQFRIDVPNVARYLVRRGREILIDPAPGVDEDSIRVFLLGSVLGALLLQRGLLVLHGNAIAIGEGCMICVGPSGVGKSTLAAGFRRRGHSILADDVVPIDEACRAIPGFPRIKLWQDAADQLAIDTTNLRRIRPNTHKFNLPILSGFQEASMPVKWIYVLTNQHHDPPAITPIKGVQRFTLLRRNTYRMRYVDGMALKARHLGRCEQLARGVHLARVARPQKGFTVESVIDAILHDIETAG